ncbi:hypothetical protein Tco_0503369 [Tanacetum coccineum]
MVAAVVEWHPRWYEGHGGKEVEVVRRSRCWEMVVVRNGEDRGDGGVVTRMLVMMVAHGDDGGGCDSGGNGGGLDYGRRGGDGVVYSIAWWLSWW